MDLAIAFISLGALLLVGLLTDEIGRRTRLPRVTLLIVFGIAAGSSGLDLLPDEIQDWYPALASAALTMVAFLLGGKLSMPVLRHNGKAILWISLAAVHLTALIVGAGLLVVGTPLLMALMLAGIATATAPAATQDVVRQSRAKGRFTDVLLGVVAVDDAWGLIVFSLILVLANAMVGDGGVVILTQALWELGGALAIGLGLGVPAAFLTGRLRPGEPIQAEALGVVFLCAGLAIWLEVSFLLAGMVAGAVVANFAKHHTRPFHEIEQIEWPFMVLFFVVAGASLQLDALGAIGVVGVSYIVLRAISRIAGGWIGAAIAGAPRQHRAWMGFALTPQAGVALGMALVAGIHFPELREPVIAITVGTTVVFELVGPLLTQLALIKVGEAGQQEDELT